MKFYTHILLLALAIGLTHSAFGVNNTVSILNDTRNSVKVFWIFEPEWNEAPSRNTRAGGLTLEPGLSVLIPLVPGALGGMPAACTDPNSEAFVSVTINNGVYYTLKYNPYGKGSHYNATISVSELEDESTFQRNQERMKWYSSLIRIAKQIVPIETN